VKAAFVLGTVISLIGGVAPRLIKADGKIDLIVKGEANVAVDFGKLKSSGKSAAGSKAVSKKNTKAAVKKGDKTMTTIGSILNGVGQAWSLPGE
jgi:hypothetical protein